ncbi:hypothetical protein TrLO_g3358 [Triparma laevis f. longispina]|uniref:Plastid lipid-associated protein/fibrillin conserved domain-containing protein n=1 Tax=Triparma laevis f. longispina TaxID=1714387 RepID=A0A9W7BXB6_9STRA|nr:hypothetical protein TrLO_g3358 [Triparma laevis f. longispina]
MLYTTLITIVIIILALLSHSTAFNCAPTKVFQPKSTQGSTTRIFGKPQSRRAVLAKISVTVVAPAAVSFSALPAFAADSKEDIIVALKKTIEALAPLGDRLEKGEYDGVRSVLKGPGVGELWNLGASKNPIGKLARTVDDMSLLELSDELQLSLQMSDQLTYDCAFVYTQPGNGKVDIKSPQTMLKKSMKQLQDIIDQANESQ